MALDRHRICLVCGKILDIPVCCLFAASLLQINPGIPQLAHGNAESVCVEILPERLNSFYGAEPWKANLAKLSEGCGMSCLSS